MIPNLGWIVSYGRNMFGQLRKTLKILPSFGSHMWAPGKVMQPPGQAHGAEIYSRVDLSRACSLIFLATECLAIEFP